MHYDNPKQLSGLSCYNMIMIIAITGVVDSSGMIFYYIDTPRQHNAGILEVGHQVNQFMIIPPKARNYTIFGFCSAGCTQVCIYLFL